MVFHNDNRPIEIFHTSGESVAHTHKVTKQVSAHSARTNQKSQRGKRDAHTQRVVRVHKHALQDRELFYFILFLVLTCCFVALVLIHMYKIMSKNKNKNEI